MRKLVAAGLIIVAFHSLDAVAAPACAEVFGAAKVRLASSPEALMTKLYDESQFFGIAVADHSNFQPFQRLVQLLEARGMDPALKTVVIEDSYLRTDLYAKISVEEMTLDEYKREATAIFGNFHAQDEFLFEHVFPLLRKINAKRPKDPVLAVPVDGVTNPTAMETAWGVSTPARVHSLRLSRRFDVSKLSNVYGSSILRERETAAHFKTLVSDRFPDRKAIIIYQGAHILKNLAAYGADTDARGKVVKRSLLSWIEIAANQIPELKAGYKVIAVDNKSESWAPQGFLNLPAGLSHQRNAYGVFWSPTTSKASPLFPANSFMGRYREGSIDAVRSGAPVFDGAIIEP